MIKTSYSDWLQSEYSSLRQAVLALMEHKDRLLYVDADVLKAKYMERIGNREEKVLLAELEVWMLRRKLQLLQIAVNRGEPIDLAAIDKQVEAERVEKIKRMEHDDPTNPVNKPVLDVFELDELQQKYREILHACQPDMNLNATATEKELYEKAQNAYQNRNLDALRLIHDMVFKPSIPPKNSEAEVPINIGEIRRQLLQSLSMDFTLAAKLFPMYSHTDEENGLFEQIKRLSKKKDDLTAEIEDIESRFPFSAKLTLSSDTLIEEYLVQLRFREQKSESEKKEMQAEVDRIVKENQT